MDAWPRQRRNPLGIERALSGEPSKTRPQPWWTPENEPSRDPKPRVDHRRPADHPPAQAGHAHHEPADPGDPPPALQRRHRGPRRSHHHRWPGLRQREPGEHQEQSRRAFRPVAAGPAGGQRECRDAAPGPTHQGQHLRPLGGRDRLARRPWQAPRPGRQRTARRTPARQPGGGLDPGQRRHRPRHRGSRADARPAPPPALQAEDRRR